MAKSLPAIIWDLDQTLVRIELHEGSLDRWRQDLANFFHPWGWEKPFRPLLSTLEDGLIYLQAFKSPQEIQRLREDLYADLDQKEALEIRHIHIIDSMVRRMSRWNQQGAPIALVSNNGAQGMHQALNAINTFLLSENRFLPQWTVVLSRAARYLPKPHADGMKLALQALTDQGNAHFSHVLVIGDSRFDWEAAAKLQTQAKHSVFAIAAHEGELSWPPESGQKDASLHDFLLDLGLTP